MAIGVKLPFVRETIQSTEAFESDRGLGDAKVQIKHRFWRHDDIGVQWGIAWVAEGALPTGGDLGREAWGAKAGLTGGVEHLVHYAWLTAEYAVRDLYSTRTDRFEWGRRILRLGAIYGIRPHLPASYRDWDLPLYVSVHYQHQGPDRENGKDRPGTGREFVTVGPSLLWSKRNIMLRWGLQFPVWEKVRGSQPALEDQQKFVLEFHF
jgi:hypothetical protein